MNCTLKGWCLKTDSGMFLYRGNANKEYRNLRLGDFWIEGDIGFMPIVLGRKYEAQAFARIWNGLEKESIKSFDRPIMCITKNERVKPVKIEVSYKLGG